MLDPSPREASLPPPPPEWIIRALLAIAAAGLLGVAICALGWYRAAHAGVELEELSAAERQLLARRLVEESPGVHRRAWFEPTIGYTLRPRAELEAWGDSFRSNELGFRTGPAAKAPGTWRVVFVGDSWTYGMGVAEEQAFPALVARLANHHSGAERPIEAWTLALPGYNTLNSLAALWFFFDRLEPDAVVICPSGNDNHSLPEVLPNGSVANVVLAGDRFGDPHPVVYRLRRLDSYRFRHRWQTSFDAIRRTEARLARLGVPMLLFFVARWQDTDVHARVADAGISAPYLLVPLELTQGRWENPPPFGHATAEAHELYARMLYRGLARLLAWQPLPAAGEGPAGEGSAEVFDAPPAGEDWGRRFDRLSKGATAVLPPSFRPSKAARIQVAGPLDPETGLMGRATTLLVRPPAASRGLEITVRRLADAPSLYPLTLTVTIPSPAGGRRAVTTVPETGPAVHRLTVEIPGDLAPGSALDVVLVAERTVAGRRTVGGRSLYVESIVPLPSIGRSR